MKNKFDFEFNPVYYNMCNISNGRDPMASHPFFHKNIASVVQCSAVVLSSALLVEHFGSKLYRKRGQRVPFIGVTENARDICVL